jgi:hypothetical protein
MAFYLFVFLLVIWLCCKDDFPLNKLCLTTRRAGDFLA